MAGFNNKYRVSNNYTTACRDTNKVRIYEYSDGTYTFINNVKTPIKLGTQSNGKILVDNGEFHHSKSKNGQYNSVKFWEWKEK